MNNAESDHFTMKVRIIVKYLFLLLTLLGKSYINFGSCFFLLNMENFKVAKRNTRIIKLRRFFLFYKLNLQIIGGKLAKHDSAINTL